MKLGRRTIDLYRVDVGNAELNAAFESQQPIMLGGPDGTSVELTVTGLRRQLGTARPEYFGRATCWAVQEDGTRVGEMHDWTEGMAFSLSGGRLRQSSYKP